MKSEHRHELETNVLAHGLEGYIERYRPYFGKIIGAILAVIALMFAWSYVSGSNEARNSGAWDAYNLAISSMPPNLDLLRQTAQDNANTPLQRLADVTWADGQVFNASMLYVNNHTAANEALTKAASAYQGVIQTSDDPQITSRARLGLARVYEMQNDLEKARQQYEQVTGTYAKYAKVQAERLAKPEAKEVYAWLSTAQAPLNRPPMGPGTPGKSPEFTPGEIALPKGSDTTSANGKAETTPSASESFEKLLKDMQKDTKTGAGDGPKNGTPGGDAKTAPAGENKPAAESKEAAPPAKADAPKQEEKPKTETPKGEAAKTEAPAAPAPAPPNPTAGEKK